MIFTRPDPSYLRYRYFPEILNEMAFSGQVLMHSPHDVQSGSPSVFPRRSGLIVGQGDFSSQVPHSVHLSWSTRIRAGAIFSKSQVIAPMGQML